MESSSTPAVPPEYRSLLLAHVENSSDSEYVPPSEEDPKNGVRSKDVIISPQVSARIFLPKITKSDPKLPILIYIHGGIFMPGSAFSPGYHSYVSALASEANAIAVSINYRLAPEYRIPASYEDSWAAFMWVVSHAKDRQGPEPWINDHADFLRLYFAGDDSGSNISHNVIVRATDGGLEASVKISGMVLICPFFGDGNPEFVWTFLGPEKSKADDPWLYPITDLNLLSKIVCSKVLVCTAEKDRLRKGGWLYYEALKNCGWGGEPEYVEIEGEEHCFHLKNPTSEKAKTLMSIVASFIY